MGMGADGSWVIRPSSIGDYEAAYGLSRVAGEGLSLRPSDLREEIEKKLLRDPELFLVAEVGQQVVGVIMGAWDGRRGWLHHLAVAREQRGQGIGSALVARVEEGLRRKGCLKVNLLVAERNEAARGLYQRLGYSDMPGFAPMGKEL